MKPEEYWKSLTTREKETYAVRAGSSFNYLNKHIFKPSGRSRNPKPNLIIRLASASEGNVSLEDAINFFLVDPVKELAKKELNEEQQEAA